MLLKPSQQTLGEIHTFPLREQENTQAGIFFPLFQQRLLGGRMNSQSLRHGPLCSFFLLTPFAESAFFKIYFSPLIYCIVHPR